MNDYFGNTDIWAVYGPSQKEIDEMKAKDTKKREELLAKLGEWLAENSSRLQFKVEFEDDSYDGTFEEFRRAVDFARTSELEHFVNGDHWLFYEDGYIKVIA